MVLASAGPQASSAFPAACSWPSPQGYLPSHHPLSLCPSIPCRYHNDTLLDPSLYKHESKLVLRNLRQDQAGEYFCKAQSDSGAVKSRVAQLIVIGKPVSVPKSATGPQGGGKHPSGHIWAVIARAFLCCTQCCTL